MPTDPSGKPVEGTVAEQTHQMCQNAQAVLEAAGSSLDKVVKVVVSSIYTSGLFETLNEATGVPSKHERPRRHEQGICTVLHS